ncbi:NCK-interacting protein with SH3 domain [Parasteatoda tepidariorum]|uniref:NCK-interacting protein with SH3 domain n=1 Tax=Parasteatoda tepidariorum TaxID=114398 RepID=UPI001C720E86|nr:NCK-interacting protein with SH3 domain [Parasteatoda tepidariorum]
MTDIKPILYVALYDLSSGHQHVLLFKKDDRFIPVSDSSNNPNWALCVDMRGKLGYVPHTYINKVEINPDEYIFLVEDALEKIHAESPNSISKRTREAMKYLSDQRTIFLKNQKICNEYEDICSNKVLNNHETSHSEDSPRHAFQLSSSSHIPVSESNSSLPNDVQNNVASIAIHSETKNHAELSTQTDCITDYTVPTWLVPSLIESVRHKTQISHENSIAAVGVMLDIFKEAIPMLDQLWLQLKGNLKSEVLQEDTKTEVYSEDKRTLLDIFRQLWYCKNDEQQRSWPVHEDEDHISKLLVDLNNILVDANPRVTREIVQCDEYEMVLLLVTYYQMEPRRTLRIKMLHVFMTLCELDLRVVTHLLNSVITMELARDIQDNFEDREKVLYSTCLLAAIFSTGEQPPTGTYDFINKKFLHFLFEKLEEVVKDGEEDVGDSLLSIILSFNLHFKNPDENIVMGALKERNFAQYLTERLVFLLNREEDPSKILSHSMETPNSVMKFMVDLFHFSNLIDLFYLNDVKVLLDIVVRQLTDLLPGEKRRLEYLCLVRNLLKNSNYDEHMHQVEGLNKCFKFILDQEFPEESEVAIVTDIKNQFPSWF